MNEKGRRYNRQKRSPPYKKLLCDQRKPPQFSSASSWLLLLFASTTTTFSSSSSSLGASTAASLLLCASGGAVRSTSKRRLLLCFLDHCPKLLIIDGLLGDIEFCCMMHRTISSLVPNVRRVCADSVRDALLQQSLYGVVNTHTAKHDAVESRWIERKNWNPY